MGRDTIWLKDVICDLLSKERSRGNRAAGVMDSASALVAITGRKKKSNNAPKGSCWGCYHSVHLKSDCSNKGKEPCLYKVPKDKNYVSGWWFDEVSVAIVKNIMLRVWGQWFFVHGWWGCMAYILKMVIFWQLRGV